MRIIVAPDSFKESLDARRVCAAVAEGLARDGTVAEVYLGERSANLLARSLARS